MPIRLLRYSTSSFPKNAGSNPSFQPTLPMHKLIIAVMFASLTVQAAEVCEFTGRSFDDVECSNKRWQVVERTLNAKYQALLKELDEIVKQDPQRLSDLKTNLISAQRAWVSFREKDCRAVEVWWTNGKLQGALYANCMKGHAQQRIKELNDFTSHQT